MFIPIHDANTLRHIRVQWVTLAIIAINCIVWLIGATFEDAQSSRATMFSFGFVPAVANGYKDLPPEWSILPVWATYVTYAFFHGSFMHLVGNMLFVWVFGDNVEDAMGHLRFIVFYLACAAAGAFAHSLADPESISPLVGASGAAAGLIAAYLLLHPHVKVWVLALGRIPIRISALWVISAWILFQFANFAFTDGHDVSWAAHIGGVVAGAVLIPFFKRRDVPLFGTAPVDEVIPPVPPPAVAEEGYALPGQPHQPDGHSLPEDSTNEDSATDENKPALPWGRQRRD